MPNKIIASTNSETYVFEPCSTDNPIILPMSLGEVKEIHSKSRIFADGWLSFEDDVKLDIYKYLKIRNGEDILNQIEIMHCIIDGTKNDVEKLINIKSKGYFERVYGVYGALKQSNMYDISMRVAKAIEYRYKELQRGIINTQIELSDSFKTDSKDETISQQQDTIAEQSALLEKQNEELNKTNETIAALQDQIAQLMSAMQSMTNSNNSKGQGGEVVTNATAGKRGRPPKTTK